MGKVKLNVLGLSYSQSQTGAYALVLAEEDGERRIPIIIGGFEAQSIAIELEGLKPPRPLTHDLFVNFSTAFNIDIVEVNIYKLEEGIFYSELVCDNGNLRIKIDARTSDAVALAIRFKCPIFTTEGIIQKAGIVLNLEAQGQKNENETAEESPKISADNPRKSKFASMELEELQQALEEAISREDYEEASLIRDELRRRK